MRTIPWAALALLLNLNTATADPVTVVIRDFRFEPANVTVPVGTTVRWVNQEKRQYHNVWFEATGEAEPPYLFPGESSERRFDSAGHFPYRCGPHPEMVGTVLVEE